MNFVLRKIIILKGKDVFFALISAFLGAILGPETPSRHVKKLGHGALFHSPKTRNLGIFVLPVVVGNNNIREVGAAVTKVRYHRFK